MGVFIGLGSSWIFEAAAKPLRFHRGNPEVLREQNHQV